MYQTKFGTSRPSHKSCHFAVNSSRTYKYFKLYAHSTHLKMARWDILEPKYMISITQKK